MNHPQCKLTDYQIEHIRALRKSGLYRVQDLAAMYAVAHTTISSVTVGKRMMTVGYKR